MNDGKNPINRYIINSPMLPDLKKNADGSLTLYIQNASPGSDKESNWLPGRDGPIYLLRATGRSPNLPPGEPPGFSSAAQLREMRGQLCPLWVKNGLSSPCHSMSALPLKTDTQTIEQHVR